MPVPVRVPVLVHVPVPASDITKVTHQARGDPGWTNQLLFAEVYDEALDKMNKKLADYMG